MSNTVLKIENLTVNYDNNHTALENINLSVKEKEYLCILGQNGGGKTTLLKSILGLLPFAKGSITICGKNIKDGRKLVGYVPQFSMQDKSFPITALEVVLTGMQKSSLQIFYRYTNEQKEIALHLLEEMGIANLAKQQMNELSGGQIQRVLIARAMAVNPQILLLDEPTASVDPASRETIYGLLDKLHTQKTIILVTHDLMAVSQKVDSIACLNKTLIYHGEPKLTEETVNSMFGCPVDLIAHGVPHRVLSTHTHCNCNEEGHKC